MATTYSTSAQCGSSAGMKVVSASSRPTTTIIDAFRDEAYVMIGKVIGQGASDSNNVARTVERQLVRPLIMNLNKDEPSTTLKMVMTSELEAMLLDEFPTTADIGWLSWVPGQNTG